MTVECKICAAIGPALGEFPHKADCYIGLIERGKLCPNCSEALRVGPSPNKEHFACQACGYHWDEEETRTDYRSTYA